MHRNVEYKNGTKFSSSINANQYFRNRAQGDKFAFAGYVDEGF